MQVLFFCCCAVNYTTAVLHQTTILFCQQVYFILSNDSKQTNKKTEMSTKYSTLNLNNFCYFFFTCAFYFNWIIIKLKCRKNRATYAIMFETIATETMQCWWCRNLSIFFGCKILTQEFFHLFKKTTNNIKAGSIQCYGTFTLDK